MLREVRDISCVIYATVRAFPWHRRPSPADRVVLVGAMCTGLRAHRATLGRTRAAPEPSRRPVGAARQYGTMRDAHITHEIAHEHETASPAPPAPPVGRNPRARRPRTPGRPR